MEKKEGWKPGYFLHKGMEKVKGDSEQVQLALPPPTPPVEMPGESFGAGSSAAAELGADDIVPASTPLSAMPMFTTTSEPFYLNVVVVDSSAAVAKQVKVIQGS
jgi:hypothetical protein